jgi:hypothetical protein
MAALLKLLIHKQTTAQQLRQQFMQPSPKDYQDFALVFCPLMPMDKHLLRLTLLMG